MTTEPTLPADAELVTEETLISPIDLLALATEAIAAGEDCYLVRRQARGLGPSRFWGTVTTLVVPGQGRAGQVTNGDAVWGDYDPGAPVGFTTEDGLAITFDGEEIDPEA